MQPELTVAVIVIPWWGITSLVLIGLALFAGGMRLGREFRRKR